MKAIYKRELGAYFRSMQAYIFLALFVCITGVFFSIVNISYGYNDFAGYVLSNTYYMLFIYAIVIPILTMRMFAEEKKQKTDQLLLTAPVSVWEIVLGKYLACITVSILPDGAVPTLIFFGVLVVAIAVIFYLDTRKIQISGIALFVGAAVTAGLYFWKKDWFVYGLTSSLNWLSLEKRYEEFLNGMVNLSSVIYMLSVCAVCLFLTTCIIRRRRWR